VICVLKRTRGKESRGNAIIRAVAQTEQPRQLQCIPNKNLSSFLLRRVRLLEAFSSSALLMTSSFLSWSCLIRSSTVSGMRIRYT
jgi:hypothetical protein